MIVVHCLLKSVLASGRSSQVSSSHRPRKRVTFADDTPVSACVSECSRSTQRPSRTSLGGDHPENNHEKTTAWHSSMMPYRSHPFSAFFGLAECRFLAL